MKCKKSSLRVRKKPARLIEDRGYYYTNSDNNNNTFKTLQSVGLDNGRIGLARRAHGYYVCPRSSSSKHYWFCSFSFP